MACISGLLIYSKGRITFYNRIIKIFKELLKSLISNIFQNERYEPLQDSAEYIDSLETKLRKISSGNNKNKDKAQHREQVLANLLRSDSKQVLGILSDSDIALDREIDRNQIISRIIPKQPLTAGETVRLIQSDVLDQNFAKNLEESAKDEEKLKELDN